MAIKLPVPLGPCEAYLLGAVEASRFLNALAKLRGALRGVAPAERFATYAGTRSSLQPSPDLPFAVWQRLEQFLRDEDAGHTLVLEPARDVPATDRLTRHKGEA